MLRIKPFTLMVIIASLIISSCQAATPATQPTAAAPEATAPAAAVEPGEKVRVALIVENLGDRSFMDAAARGITWVNERLPEIETKIVESRDIGEQQLAARNFANEGWDLVITVGFREGEWTYAMAKEFPNINFAGVDQLQDEAAILPNMTGLLFKEHEGSFTVGMAAALLTNSTKIGYVSWQDVPLMRRFEGGFIDGVKYVNPDLEVITSWSGDPYDPAKCKELSLTQYSQGIDIIYQAAGPCGAGSIAAAKETGNLVIGVDSEQSWIEPGFVAGTMLKLVEQAVFDAVKSLTEGKLEGGNRSYGLAEGGVGWTYLYNDDRNFLDNGPAEYVAKMPAAIEAVKEAAEKFKTGELCVVDFMGVYPCENPAQPGGFNK